MYLLIYLSKATKPISDAELDALLEQSRAWNRSVNITGMLLHSGDSFMQFLEGEREEVLSLLDKIRVDPRHRGLIVLVQEEHPKREFKNWAMAYKKLEDETRLEVPGYSDYVELPLSREKFLINPTKTLELLLAFKKTLSPSPGLNREKSSMYYMVVYVSSATELFSATALAELLEKARPNNRSLTITGMLLYKGGNFMQLLEGPREAVLALVEKIKRDGRHTGFMMLFQQEKKEREFSDWEMGFQNLEGRSAAPLAGQSDFLKIPFDDQEYQTTPSKALKLLLSFKKIVG